MFSRNAVRAMLLVILGIAVIQGIAVLRTTTWPIERWFGAW